MKAKVKKLDINSAYKQTWGVFSDGVCIKRTTYSNTDEEEIKEDDENDGIIHDGV